MANMPKRIAFQGEKGAFSHAAAHAVFPHDEAVPCLTFEDTITAVQNEDADYGIVPVENSLYGRITDIHHLLPESGLYIVGEYYLRIEMNLLGVKGARLEDIKTVQSLSVALGQCRKFIQEHKFRTVNAIDTAGSAKEVAERGDKSVASLCPPRAASIYGLEVLAKNVEDEHHNTTRFIVLAPEPATYEPGSAPMITSFVFQVRNVPAALYKALGGFATNGVNMTKLESYQLGGGFFATRFYADVEGHPDDPALSVALEELAFFCVHLRIIGTYPASGFRATIAEALGNRVLRPNVPEE